MAHHVKTAQFHMHSPISLNEICRFGKEIKLSVKNNNQSTEKATIYSLIHGITNHVSTL